MRDAAEPTDFDRAWEHTEYVALTPNEHVRVAMTGDRDLEVWVESSWFARSSRTAVETELARAAKLLYVARTRAYYDASSRVAGMTISPVKEYVSDKQRRYFEGLEQLQAKGSSPDGGVTVTMVGSSQFTVDVHPHDLGQPPSAFSAACRMAAMACFEDHTEAWQRLHFDIYTRPEMERAGLL